MKSTKHEFLSWLLKCNNRKLGPIRTSGQVLNVMTFLTTKKLSRQVRDILKKTKGVIIITIALHVLLSSWYISQHGRLVQTSNNQQQQQQQHTLFAFPITNGIAKV